MLALDYPAPVAPGLAREAVDLLQAAGLEGGSGPEPWALAFDQWVQDRLADHDAAALADWPHAPGSAESVPTSEHLEPLFVALGASQGAPETLFDGWQLGSLSLKSYVFR